MNKFVDAGMRKKNLDYLDRDLLRYDPYKKELRYAEDDDRFVEIDGN